jgi:hypothetical protein
MIVPVCVGKIQKAPDLICWTLSLIRDTHSGPLSLPIPSLHPTLFLRGQSDSTTPVVSFELNRESAIGEGLEIDKLLLNTTPPVPVQDIFKLLNVECCIECFSLFVLARRMGAPALSC